MNICLSSSNSELNKRFKQIYLTRQLPSAKNTVSNGNALKFKAQVCPIDGCTSAWENIKKLEHLGLKKRL